MSTIAENLAVFDLDGTLWSVNSHYELLNLYYNTHFWTSLPYRCLAKLFPRACACFRDRRFVAVPDDFIESVSFPFAEEYVRLLESKRDEGFFVLIVSNAPRDAIVRGAAERLRCAWLRAGEGQKREALERNYQYSRLFVCTDNKTDCDLLSAADDYCIVAENRRNRAFFRKRGFYVA